MSAIPALSLNIADKPSKGGKGCKVGSRRAYLRRLSYRHKPTKEKFTEAVIEDLMQLSLNDKQEVRHVSFRVGSKA